MKNQRSLRLTQENSLNALSGVDFVVRCEIEKKSLPSLS